MNTMELAEEYNAKHNNKILYIGDVLEGEVIKRALNEGRELTRGDRDALGALMSADTPKDAEI